MCFYMQMKVLLWLLLKNLPFINRQAGGTKLFVEELAMKFDEVVVIVNG